MKKRYTVRRTRHRNRHRHRYTNKMRKNQIFKNYTMEKQKKINVINTDKSEKMGSIIPGLRNILKKQYKAL